METENMLKQLLDGQKQMTAKLENIEARLGNVEGQQKENTQLIGVLLHRTEELGAQVNALGHTLVQFEGTVNQIDQKVDKLDKQLNQIDVQQNSMAANMSFLLRKAAEHDDAIRLLRRA